MAVAILLASSPIPAFSQTWIIDGHQTQTLNLNVTDPTAARADGSNITDAAAFRAAIDAASTSDLPATGRSIIIPAGTNALANGTALLDAYATAAASAPAAGDDIILILPPALYDLGSGTLHMDTDHIHLQGSVPITLTHLGAVPVEYDGITHTGYSAVLSGVVPHSTIKSTGAAITNSVSHSSVAFVKIEGAVFTAGDQSAFWQDVWFADPVDTDNATSNTFFRVYAPEGLCSSAAQWGSGQNHFLGTLSHSVVQGMGSVGGWNGLANATLIRNTITGDFTVGSGPLTMDGLYVGNTIVGDLAVGGAGLVSGTYIENLIVGMSVVGGEDGAVDAYFARNTIHGNFSVGCGGPVTGTFVNNWIYGQSAVAGGLGSIDAQFFYNQFGGLNLMSPTTVHTNTLFAFCTGLPSDMTNTAARIIFSTDQSMTPIPNQ